MPRALLGRMPRLCMDHRSRAAKLLRPIYDDLVAQYPVFNGLGRREALLTAQSWIKFQSLSKEIERLTAQKRQKGNALAIRRLERQLRQAIGLYRGGIVRLKEYTQEKSKPDMAKALASQRTRLETTQDEPRS